MNFLRAVLTGVRDSGAAALRCKAPDLQCDDHAAAVSLLTDVPAPVSPQGSRHHPELTDVQQPSQSALMQAYVHPPGGEPGQKPDLEGNHYSDAGSQGSSATDGYLDHISDAASKHSRATVSNSGAEHSEKGDAKEEAPGQLMTVSGLPESVRAADSDPAAPCTAAADTSSASDAAATISCDTSNSTELSQNPIALPGSPDHAASAPSTGIVSQRCARADSEPLPADVTDSLQPRPAASDAMQLPASGLQQEAQLAQQAQQTHHPQKSAARDAHHISSESAGDISIHDPRQQEVHSAAPQEAEQQQQQLPLACDESQASNGPCAEQSSDGDLAPEAAVEQRSASDASEQTRNVGVSRKSSGLPREGLPLGWIACPTESDSGERSGQSGGSDSKLQEHPVESIQSQVPAAEPQPAPVTQLSRAHKKQPGVAPAQALPGAGPHTGVEQQRQPGAGPARGPPGAALYPGTGRQDRPGAAPAKPPHNGWHRRGQPGTAPGRARPGPGAGASATRQKQEGPAHCYGPDTPQPTLFPSDLCCGMCTGLLAAPYSLAPCGHAFCGICVAQRLASRLTCPVCRHKIDGPPERAYGFLDPLEEQQRHMSRDEQQRYWDRCSAFTSKVAEVEASWRAFFTQFEDADEYLQQAPQHSSQHMRRPLQHGQGHPMYATHGPAGHAQQWAGTGHAPAQCAPPGAPRGWVHCPVPSAMPPPPHMPNPMHARPERWQQQPSGPPMPHQSHFAPPSPQRLQPCRPPWRLTYYDHLVPWAPPCNPPMEVPSPTRGPPPGPPMQQSYSAPNVAWAPPPSGHPAYSGGCVPCPVVDMQHQSLIQPDASTALAWQGA